MVTNKKKILAGILLLLLMMVAAALTIARPTTAKVYHSLCYWYTDLKSRAAVEELYEYKPSLEKRIDMPFQSKEPAPLTEEEEAVYAQTVSVLLQEDLWTPRDMYDSAHFLMVPMHYVFYSMDQEKMNEFHSFFARFYEDVTGDDQYGFLEQSADVNMRQFHYFCCEYLRLAAMTGQMHAVPDGLYDFLYDQAEWFFIETPGVWSTEKNTLSRVEQILLHKKYDYSYYSSLTDIDMFPLASLCDLRTVACSEGYEVTELMDKASMLAYRIFSDPQIITETENGGFLLQVGVEWDYSDNQYAGNIEITADMQPKPKMDIVADSSHFMRYALWLDSFQQSQTYQEQYDLFQMRKEQLANQLTEKVIVYVDNLPLATIFMDGSYGVYRYSYNTEGVGHEKYSLSSALLMGWWAFLDDQRITGIYEDIQNQFPMSARMDNPYYDYAVTREQNAFFDPNYAFGNGMYECIVSLAAKL